MFALASWVMRPMIVCFSAMMFSFDVVCARARVEREAMAPQVGGWVPSAAAGASLSPPLLGGG